jgi:hypothetical protein
MRKVLLATIATAAMAVAMPAFADNDNNINSNLGFAASTNALSQTTVSQSSGNTNSSSNSNPTSQVVGGGMNTLSFGAQIINNNALNTGANQNAGGAIAISAGVGALGGVGF